MTEKGSGQRKVNYTKWQVGKKNGKLSVTLWVVISSSFFPFLSALCILYFVRRQKGVESSLSGKSEQNEWTTVFSLGPSEAAHTAAKLWNGSILLRCQQVRFIHLLIYLSIYLFLIVRLFIVAVRSLQQNRTVPTCVGMWVWFTFTNPRHWVIPRDVDV